jgi:hypothetical protein
MKVISYTLLAIFSALLIVLIPIGTILFSANTTFLKPYHSEAYLADSGIYSDFKQMIRKKIVGETPIDKQSVINKLRGKLVGQAFDKIVTDDFVSLKMGLLQTSLWDYLTDKTNTLIAVPIPEISDMLMKLPGEKSAEHGDLVSLLGLKAQQLESFKTNYLLYNKGLWVLYALILIMLGLCVVLTYALNISGKWLGVSLLIGGGLSLLLMIPIKLWPSIVSYPRGMNDFSYGINGLIVSVRHDLLQRMSIVAVIVIVFGVLTLFIKQRKISYIDMD